MILILALAYLLFNIILVEFPGIKLFCSTYITICWTIWDCYKSVSSTRIENVFDLSVSQAWICVWHKRGLKTVWGMNKFNFLYC